MTNNLHPGWPQGTDHKKPQLSLGLLSLDVITTILRFPHPLPL